MRAKGTESQVSGKQTTAVAAVLYSHQGIFHDGPNLNVAPIGTITGDTASETPTLTTTRSQWDISMDTSAGVGATIFKPNGTITASNTAGTCTMPPTNFSVSYNISPILRN